MLQNDRQVATGFWLVAGVPIIAAFLQSVLAVAGIDAVTIPIVGELKQTLTTVEVFDIAGTVFRNNNLSVFGLFILVAFSWIGVGVSMLSLENRQFTYAAAGLVTVFLALFFLVYSPLLSEGIPAIQLLGFIAIPVISVGSIWLSVISYEWTTTLNSEAIDILTETRRRAEEAQQEFESEIKNQADERTLDMLAQAAPESVAEFKQSRNSFLQECKDIQNNADQVASESDGPTGQDRLRQAKQLRSKAKGLNPIEKVEASTDNLRVNIERELRNELAVSSPSSTYDRSYTVRNLNEYNELSLPEIEGPPVQLGVSESELEEQLIVALDSGTPLPDIAQAVNKAAQRISKIEHEIKHHESKFDDQLHTIETTLSDAETALSRIDTSVGERLREILFEDRFGDKDPPFPTKIDIHNRVDEAKTALHNCRFDRALRLIDTGITDAKQIKQIVLFFTDSVIPTIDHGSGSIPIPTDVSPELIEKMGPEILQTYDVTYTIDDQTLNIDTDEETTNTANHATEARQQSHAGEGPPPEDVLYLLRELRQAVDESDAQGTGTIQLAEYPEKFAQEKITDVITSFLARQNQIAEVSAPSTDPGYIKITVTDNESASRALTDICDRYREQYT